MKEVKLISIEIENFKCFEYYKANFNGRNAVIAGRNASGKSSIADAYFWLLTGKNMANETKFAVTPLDKNGHEKRGCITRVKAVFTINGKQVSLTKEQIENTGKKANLSPDDIAPKTSNYYIDDIPVQTERAFKNFINENIGSETTIAYLTNINHFTSMKPDMQRTHLLKLVDIDAAQLEGYEKANELCGMLSHEDKLQGLKRELKRAQEELDIIPRLKEENRRNLPEIFADYEKQLKDFQEEIKKLANDLSDINNLPEIREIQKQIEKVKQDKAKAQAEKETEYKTAIQKIKSLNKARGEVSSELYFLEKEIKGIDAEIERVASETPALICPTCKRPYDNKEEMERVFIENKTETVESLQAKKADLEKQKRPLQIKLDKLEKEIKKAEAGCKGFDFTEYDRAIDELQKNKDEIYIKTHNEITQKIGLYTQKIEQIKGYIKAQEREKELTGKQRSLSETIINLTSDISFLERFIDAKNKALEEKVNGLFKGIQFKLFEKQTNGDYKQICEPTINGIKYSDANTASRINAGLEIIDVFSNRFGVLMPIFVDNTESVNNLYQLNSQMIKLQVTNSDLRIIEEV